MYIETLRSTIYSPFQTVKAAFDKTAQFALDFFGRLPIPNVTSSQAMIYTFVAIAFILPICSATTIQMRQYVINTGQCCDQGFMTHAMNSVCWILNWWKPGDPYPKELTYSSSEVSPSILGQYTAYCGDCKVQLLDFVVVGSSNFWSYINQNITTPIPTLSFKITNCPYFPVILNSLVKNFTIHYLK